MQKVKPVPHQLHVVTMISNPRRFKRRYDLYHQFAKHMKDSGVILHTVELTFGDRQPELDISLANTIVLNTDSEIWHKENAINIAISRLPSDWKYVAWIDADIQFTRPDWASEAVHILQHHPIIQLWSTAHDMRPNYESMPRIARSFAWCYQNVNSPFPKMPDEELQMIVDAGEGIKGAYLPKNILWHPGYAWACTRECFNKLGGLLDTSILGSADRYMACALVGTVKNCLLDGFTENYKKDCLVWQERALKYVKKDLGYVEGSINHFWHGKKVNRQYTNRWNILIENKFDPYHDLKRDSQGLYQLVDDKIKLRDDLRHYFAQRNEDGIDE